LVLKALLTFVKKYTLRSESEYGSAGVFGTVIRGSFVYSDLDIVYGWSAMGFEVYVDDKLWPILVETVHALVMYGHHKAYVRDLVLPEKPDIKADELAVRLRLPVGEALVILHELRDKEKVQS